MHRPVLSLAAASALCLALAGCSGGNGTAGNGGEATEGRLSVVASTSVYADVVREIGGDAVDVKATIDSTSQDPHSYEATAQDKLALDKADLVVANGGGYDYFIEALAADLDLPDGKLLLAVDYSEAAHGEESAPPADDGHGHGAGNEHVWYDLHTMDAVADAVEARLSGLQPASAAEFQANADAFEARLKEVQASLAALEPAARGKKFAMTEPVPYFLLAEAGMEDGTPEGFSEAIEEGGDVPPLLLKELQDRLAAGEYAVLAYNAQTSGPQTDAVRSAAEAAGVAVVDFTETLPEGADYVSWMKSNVEALESALAG